MLKSFFVELKEQLSNQLINGLISFYNTISEIGIINDD